MNQLQTAVRLAKDALDSMEVAGPKASIGALLSAIVALEVGSSLSV